MPVMQETITWVSKDGTLTVRLGTADVQTHSVVTQKEGRWRYLSEAVRHALMVIAEDAKRDQKEG